MTQLHNLDPHDAQELVDQNNPVPCDTTDEKSDIVKTLDETTDAVIRAFSFLKSACEIAENANIKVNYADIEVNNGRVSFGIYQSLSHCYFLDLKTTTCEKYADVLESIKKHCAENKDSRANDIRRKIDDLTRELNELEGRV